VTNVAFDKYEGLGNDFVVVAADDERAFDAPFAKHVCDRHFGVGADGVLVLLPPRDAKHTARMKVVNADGSVPEMCGNGLRCVALHLARARGVDRGELQIETDAGVLTCGIAGDIVTVDMGVVAVRGSRELSVDGESIVPTLADAGNPHAILFGDFSRARVEALGPRIATHAAFFTGTNVEFASVVEGVIDLVVWERGVGITLACGTGACATAAVACSAGLVPYDEPVDVRLPGGTLAITIDRASGRATMRGPARHVFSGRYDF
jgi:diaminopimelate epimerase